MENETNVVSKARYIKRMHEKQTRGLAYITATLGTAPPEKHVSRCSAEACVRISDYWYFAIVYVSYNNWTIRYTLCSLWVLMKSREERRKNSM